MSDRFDDLVKAGRAAGEGAPDEVAQATRRRLLSSMRARQRKRTRLTTFVLPFAAAFVASAVWAGASGRLPRLFDLTPLPPPSALTAQATPSPAPPGRLRPAPPASSAPARDDDAAPAPVELSPTEASASPAAPIADNAPRPVADSAPRAPDIAPSAPSSRPSASAAQASQDPAEALYRKAHDVHFRGGSPAAAVEAWDTYLAASPNGRFAPEARYNRAIALIRAGRKSDGLAALRPFADGRYGAYRRDEARQLLEASGGR